MQNLPDFVKIKNTPYKGGGKIQDILNKLYKIHYKNAIKFRDSQKIEVRDQRIEVRRQKSEVGGQRSFVIPLLRGVGAKRTGCVIP
jgi:hypothetical protein